MAPDFENHAREFFHEHALDMTGAFYSEPAPFTTPKPHGNKIHFAPNFDPYCQSPNHTNIQTIELLLCIFKLFDGADGLMQLSIKRIITTDCSLLSARDRQRGREVEFPQGEAQ